MFAFSLGHLTPDWPKRCENDQGEGRTLGLDGCTMILVCFPGNEVKAYEGSLTPL